MTSKRRRSTKIGIDFPVAGTSPVIRVRRVIEASGNRFSIASRPITMIEKVIHALLRQSGNRKQRVGSTCRTRDERTIHGGADTTMCGQRWLRALRRSQVSAAK
jgi:hypothetical protein